MTTQQNNQPTKQLIKQSSVILDTEFRSQSSNSPHFMAPEGSLPCSQLPATSPYPMPHQFRTRYSPPNPIYFRSTLILSVGSATRCQLSTHASTKREVDKGKTVHEYIQYYRPNKEMIKTIQNIRRKQQKHP